MKFSVAKDFSMFPTGRTKADSQSSGEAFRNVLREFLLYNTEVIIDLDSTMGYASNWLDEAFGCLITKDGFTSEELHQKLTILSCDKSLIVEIWSYIDE